MSILATDKKLISFGTDYSAGSGISIIDHTISVTGEFGKTYSAGDNINIYQQDDDYYISGKDWSNEISDASANSYTQSTSYFNDWINGQYAGDITNITNNLTSLSGDLSGYYKKTETSSKEQISDALQYVSANAGKVYEGVSPIVVNNTEDKISADTWKLSAGSNVSFIDDSANKVTRIDVDLPQQDLTYISAQVDSANQSVNSLSGSVYSLSSTININSGVWNEVSAKVDTTALIPTIDSNTISYSSKPTDSPIYASDNDLKNVNSIQGKSDLAIVPNGVLQVPNIITAAHGVLQVPNAITATNGNLTVQNTITAAPNNTLNVPGVITSNPGGLTANGLSANITGGLTANGLTADAVHSGFSANGISAGKSGPLFIEGMYESIYANTATGFTFSSQNTALGTAQLGIAQGNSVVQMYAPMFEARNISGAGFSIEASGAKGYNESGNVVWDTSNPQVKNIISYSDTKTAQGGLNGNIILTTQPSTNASNLTNSPYVIMDSTEASYFAAYGPSAQTPTVRLVPGTITVEYEAGNAKTTVGYNDIKQELSGSSWTLTGSIQKRELEYDSNTSAITAINGSALACGDEGVNLFVTENSASILDVNNSYKANSGTFLTAIPSDVATTGDVANLEQTISETYYPKSNPSSFATESWVNGQGYLTAHQDISNKLDSSAFISVSGDFLTTSFSIPESAVWNETSNVVQTNSAQWAQGGGGSVSSKYGTISVDGSNIEATNKALEFNSNGFTSSFGNKYISNSSPSLVLNWDNYSQETNIHVNGLSMSNQSGTLTYSSNTDVTGEVTAAPNNPIDFNIQTPNATSIQFTTDITFQLSTIEVTAPSSFKAKELAWKSDLPTYEYDRNHKVSAINGNALVGNEDYLVEQGFVQNLASPKGTVSVLNNNKIEGTNSAIASDVIEGFVSSYNYVMVQPGMSSTLTWERYVPNTMLFVSGAEHYQDHPLTYSADTNVTGTITVPTGGQVSVEIPSGTTSIVIGNEDWSTINYNFTVSADNYYEIGELAWASAIPTYEYDSTNKISAINGSALAGGSDVPSGTMNVSGLEYNAVNEISAYNGSAIAQYGAEKQWLQHDDTLVHASNSAQYALGVNVSALQRLMGIDETVLYDDSVGIAASASTAQLSEPLTNFKFVDFYYQGMYRPSPIITRFVIGTDNTKGFRNDVASLDGTATYNWVTNITANNTTLGFTRSVMFTQAWNGTSRTVSNPSTTGSMQCGLVKVIGIGRKA